MPERLGSKGSACYCKCLTNNSVDYITAVAQCKLMLVVALAPEPQLQSICRARSDRGEQAPDREPVNLERWRFRQARDKFPVHRDMRGQQMLAQVGRQFLYQGPGHPVAQLNGGCGNFTHPRVRNANYAGRGNRRMQQQGLFHRFGQDLEASSHDCAVSAPTQKHKSFTINHGQVGSDDPVAADSRGHDFQQPLLSRGQYPSAVRIDNAGPEPTGEDSANAAEPGGTKFSVQVDRPAGYRATELCRAIGQQDGNVVAALELAVH